MKFSLNKIFSPLEKKDAEKKTPTANYTEDIINSIEEKAFAISEHNVMYAGMKELAGYHYFRTILVGKFKAKTFKGAELKIICKNTALNLKSDMNELESDHSDVPNRYITSIDFEIDKDQIKILNKSKIESLQVISKKQDVIFKPIEN